MKPCSRWSQSARRLTGDTAPRMVPEPYLPARRVARAQVGGAKTSHRRARMAQDYAKNASCGVPVSKRGICGAHYPLQVATGQLMLPRLRLRFGWVADIIFLVGEMAESAEGARLLSECRLKGLPRVRIPLSPPCLPDRFGMISKRELYGSSLPRFSPS